MTIALYQQVSEDLLRKISSGKLPVGSLLPTEIELMQTYQTSRNTVRAAAGVPWGIVKVRLGAVVLFIGG